MTELFLKVDTRERRGFLTDELLGAFLFEPECRDEEAIHPLELHGSLGSGNRQIYAVNEDIEPSRLCCNFAFTSYDLAVIYAYHCVHAGTINKSTNKRVGIPYRRVDQRTIRRHILALEISDLDLWLSKKAKLKTDDGVEECLVTAGLDLV